MEYFKKLLQIYNQYGVKTCFNVSPKINNEEDIILWCMDDPSINITTKEEYNFYYFTKSSMCNENKINFESMKPIILCEFNNENDINKLLDGLSNSNNNKDILEFLSNFDNNNIMELKK